MEFALLFVAGVIGGLVGSIAGLASISTYPALLATGLSPVDANITNSVALIFISLGSVSGSRPELKGQRSAVRQLFLPSLLGGIAGALLLLFTPSDAFEKIVPFMIAAASVMILIPKRRTTTPASDVSHPGWLWAGVALVSVYCGYFGAGAGVVLMAMLLHATTFRLAKANALKNVLLGVSNGIAGVMYLFSGHVHWLSALPLAAGLFIGGWTGPAVVRRVPSRPLRAVVGLAGLTLAALLFARAH